MPLPYLGAPVRSKLLVTRAPLNPHLDRHPTPASGVSLVRMDYLQGAGRRCVLHCDDVVAVYPPSGTCAGTLSTRRLDSLHRLHRCMQLGALTPPSYGDWLVGVLRHHPTTSRQDCSSGPVRRYAGCLGAAVAGACCACARVCRHY